MATVQIVQYMKHKWRIVTEKGHVLAEDLNISSAYDAENYIRAYVSSFHCWTYEVVPLPKVSK